MIPTERFLTGMHQWHRQAFKAFDAGLARFFSLEWHRRARKTTLWLNLAIREACRYKNRTYLLIGPTKEQERQIVWDDPNMLDAALPDKNEAPWERNEQKLQVRFANGSRIVVRGSDDPDSIRGIGPHGVGFDEWAMIDPLVWQEIVRPIIAEDSTRWAMFMFTPKGINHATEMHDRARKEPNWFASTIRASETGMFTPAELEAARRDMPLSLYDQEFECARITDEDRVLITTRMLAALAGLVAPHPSIRGRRIIACDPAMGGDECVCQYIEGGQIVEQIVLHDRDSMKVAGTLAVMGERRKCRDYVIDTIGNGKGVVDRLAEMGKNVMAFNSAEASVEPDRFANRRVEAWWRAMELVQDRHITAIDDTTLIKQLTSVHWQPQTSTGRIVLEPKDRTKKALGQSPDRADAFVMGLWGLQFVSGEKIEPRRRYVNTRQAQAANDWRAA